MAETVIACPKCSVKLKLKGDVVGKAVKCPKCATAFKIGGRSASKPARPVASPGAETPASAAGTSAKRSASKPQQESPTASAGKSSNRPDTSSSSPKPVAGSQPRRRKSAAPAESAAPKRPAAAKKKKKRTPKPAQDDFYDDGVYDEVEYDDFDDDPVDDFGFDDGYEDYGAPQSLPTRKKKKKKAKKGKRSSSSGGSSLQNSIQALGFIGWILCGSAAGLIGVVLTTLTGYTNIWFLIAAMALVTGSLVGGAVRFVAGDAQGWGPGLVAAVIALTAIMGGKVGAFYVSSDPFGEDEWTVEDEIEEATTEGAMISAIAYEVNTEWLASGKITNAQMEDHGRRLMEDFELDLDDLDTDEEEIEDYSYGFLPEVWAEAKNRWDSQTPQETEEALEARREEIRQEWQQDGLGEDGEQAVHRFRVTVAIISALVSTFLTKSGLFFFCSGVFGAFKLGSNLGTGE